MFFPVHRPRIGVSIRADGLSVVEVRHRWSEYPSVRKVVERPLSSGLVNPSATDMNVTDPDVLVRELRALYPSARTRTVALSLPDHCTSMAIFPFESLPAGQKEREAILQWRFQHDAHVAVGDAKIVARVFPVSPSLREELSPTGQAGNVTAYVLATAIKHNIVKQYRAACEQAGLFPVSIGIASLQLFDLTRPMMAPSTESFFVTQAADCMTFVGFRHGIPLALRRKRRRTHSDTQAEMLTMLQFIDSQYPHREVPHESPPSPLYMVGEGCGEAQEESTLWIPTRDRQRKVQMVRPRYSRGEKCSQIPITSWGELCALASTAAA